MDSIDRRTFVKSGVALSAAPVSVRAALPPEQDTDPLEARFQYQDGRSPWPLCLDTATIRPTSIQEKIRVASEAGFEAIEPWDGELHQWEESGRSLEELRSMIEDAGLFVPSVIGLWNAIPGTREQWEASLAASRNRMRMASAIGSEHIQVIPQPRRPWQEFDLEWASDRYRDLLEIGLKDYQVNPAIVFVQFLPGVSRLGQAAAIALDADHPNARIIPDVFHMYIGGSGFSSLRQIQGDFIAIFQFNDAPASPSRDQLKDEHRVHPGDGILPLESCLRDLQSIGYSRCISLELYNPLYWKQDPMVVAREARDKCLSVIERALRPASSLQSNNSRSHS